MKFRYAAEMEEDMGVSDPRHETSSAGATRPLSLKTVISQSRSSTKSKGASAQKKNAKRAILHQGLTVETAPSREQHREGKTKVRSRKRHKMRWLCWKSWKQKSQRTQWQLIG